MSIPKAEATAAWKSISRADRGTLIELAGTGQQHPDQDIAAAAHKWSHSEVWDSLPNRLPQWLLPLTSVVFGILLLILGMPLILVIATAVPLVCGLLGWINVHYAAVVRRAYPN